LTNSRSNVKTKKLKNDEGMTVSHSSQKVQLQSESTKGNHDPAFHLSFGAIGATVSITHNF
jgi:hypothetical protein